MWHVVSQMYEKWGQAQILGAWPFHTLVETLLVDVQYF